MTYFFYKSFRTVPPHDTMNFHYTKLINNLNNNDTARLLLSCFLILGHIRASEDVGKGVTKTSQP